MKALDIVTTGKNGFDPNTSQLAIHNTVQSPTAIMDSVPISDFTGDTLTYQEGWSWEDVEVYVEQTIEGYFEELSETWADQQQALVVRVSQIESRLLGVSGILDIADTKINGLAANYTLNLDYIPILGEITPTTGTQSS